MLLPINTIDIKIIANIKLVISIILLFVLIFLKFIFHQSSIYLSKQNGSIIISINDNGDNVIAISKADKNCIISFI